MDFESKRLNNLINKCGKIVIKWFEHNLRGKKIYKNYSPKEINSLFGGSIPKNSTEPEKILAFLESALIDTANFNPSPNYYGYITGGGNQTAIFADILKNAINQNNLKWHSAPGNTEIEKIVIGWISSFIGYNKNSGGILVSGGSVANLVNLAVMRKIKSINNISKKGVYGSKIMTVYVSEEAHSSIDKGMDILGLGKTNLRKIKVDKNFQIKPSELTKKINQDIKKGYQPIGVIGIAGTTNTGSIDPLDKLAKISKKYNLWFMVDAAYGGAAAKIPNLIKNFKGLEQADSLLINPHKWLFVPFEVACVLVKNKKHLKKTFSLVPEYLTGGKLKSDREDLMDYNIQLSKDFKALKVWMTFKTYGEKKLMKAIKNDIKVTKYAEKIVNDSKDFIALHSVTLSIFCFQYIGNNKYKNISKLNSVILDLIEKDGRIFLSGTKINNEYSLRINCINHRRTKQDIDFLFMVLREIGREAELSLI